jgi:hypothetical protein
MFRFSIRELMLVTLVVGLGTGWWLERQREREDVRCLSWKTKAMEQAFDALEYSCSFTENGFSMTTRRNWSGPPPYSLQVSKSGHVTKSSLPAYRD